MNDALFFTFALSTLAVAVTIVRITMLDSNKYDSKNLRDRIEFRNEIKKLRNYLFISYFIWIGLLILVVSSFI